MNSKLKEITKEIDRTEIFIVSVSALALNVLLLLIVLWFYLMLDTGEASNAEQSVGAVLASIVGAFAFYFIAFIASFFTAITSACGFVCGLCSVRHLPTKAKTVWAVIVTFFNFAILALSLYFIIISWNLWI